MDGFITVLTISTKRNRAFCLMLLLEIFNTIFVKIYNSGNFKSNLKNYLNDKIV